MSKPVTITFFEDEDGETYHLCDLPGPNHVHHVPVKFKTCYEEGSWTWESKYAYWEAT